MQQVYGHKVLAILDGEVAESNRVLDMCQDELEFRDGYQHFFSKRPSDPPEHKFRPGDMRIRALGVSPPPSPQNSVETVGLCLGRPFGFQPLSILLSSSRNEGFAFVKAAKGMASNDGKMSSLSCSIFETESVRRACWTFILLIHSLLT